MQKEVANLPGLTIMEDSVEDLELKPTKSENNTLRVTAVCLGIP